LVFGIGLSTTTYLAAESEPREDNIQLLDFSGPNTVVLSGIVGAEMVVPAAQKIEQLSNDPDIETIDIFINSPGGEVETGIILISAFDLAKARGKTIRCSVGIMAASMAMHFLGQCDERFAFRNSLLLFHEIYTGASKLTEKKARQMADGMKVLSEKLDGDLRRALGADESNYRHHLEAETMWPAGQLKKEYPRFNLKIIKDIKLPQNTPIFSM
jgi:ATP-dependent protease ClpP protease subunit